MATKRFIPSPGAQTSKDALKKQGFEAHMNVRLADIFFIEDRQWTPEQRDFIFKSSFDFVIIDQQGYPRVAIEYDTEYHDSVQQKRRDALKDSICTKASFTLLRYRNIHLPAIDTILEFAFRINQEREPFRPDLYRLVQELVAFAGSQMVEFKLDSIPWTSADHLVEVYKKAENDYSRALELLKAELTGGILRQIADSWGLPKRETDELLLNILVGASADAGWSAQQIDTFRQEIEEAISKRQQAEQKGKPSPNR